MEAAHRRRLIITCLVALGVLGPREAYADADAPSQKKPRPRTCCALASNLPLHLGSAHVPVVLDVIRSAQSLGPHSYSGDTPSHEWNGIVYTRRAGFIDTGHAREYADLTARLVLQLRPLLARGEGVLPLGPRDGQVRVRVLGRVSEAALADTAVRLARRIAFQISVWVEITQHYGHSLLQGAEEQFSAFTPEDLYSNLLGTYLGVAALESSLPYDRAMDIGFVDYLRLLDSTSSAEARRVLDALDGRWWRAATAWPSPAIPIAHSFEVGPRVRPLLAPEDVDPSVVPVVPLVLEVPEVDERGAPLAELYALEIVPDLHALPHFARAGVPVVTGENLPRIVDRVRAEVEAEERTRATTPTAGDGDDHRGPLAHYLVGLRLLELGAGGGIAAPPSEAPKGVAGGSFTGLHGDTRGGDFGLVHIDVGHTAERGLIAGFSLLRTDAVYFCHDPETRHVRPPLLSLLGPCARGEWLGIGGSIAEGFHDGRTGRTALRPLSLYGVVNALGNGQSPSYDGLRLLLRGGGAVEHVWTQSAGGETIPRVGGNATFLARSSSRSLEARGAVGYRIDPTTPRDAAFESSVALRWYLLLGGNTAAPLVDAVDPWAVASIGVEGSYSLWTRPSHSYAEMTAPFVSAERSGTWQLLMTVTLGFEGLTF